MEETMAGRQEPGFDEILKALLDAGKSYEPRSLEKLSDLLPEQLKALKQAWPEIKPERRIALMEGLEEIMELETRYSFVDIARFALDDLHPKVRISALRLLYEEEDIKLISVIIRMMNKDPDAEVRATAAGTLGFFVYMGVMEEISEEQATRVVDALVVKMNGEDLPLVRRRALESMGFASRVDVNILIRNAYLSHDHEWMSSAIFAMGRSGIALWEKFILAELTNPEPDVQLEAVRSAGEMYLESARQPLLDLMENSEQVDDDIRLAAITALGRIGGEGVREALLAALEICEDEDENEIIEEALSDLDFEEGNDRSLLLNFEDLEMDLEIGSQSESTAEEEIEPTDEPKKKRKHH
jgi:HEAT repeat protein